MVTMGPSNKLMFRSPPLFPFTGRPRRSPPPCSLVKKSTKNEKTTVSFTPQENSLIEALIGIQGRGRSATKLQLQEVENAVQVLEESQGVFDPTSSSAIEGRWQLMFTTRPGTASPIQRTFVGVDNFSVFQEVYLKTNDPRVSNIVRFSDAIGELKVEFTKEIEYIDRLLSCRREFSEEFERKQAWFRVYSSVNLSGELLINESEDKHHCSLLPEKAIASINDGKRILFQFDRAAFSFNFLPFKVPYPVPFKLLGDEAKGWLDTTYLSPSGNLRISRGNKGTTFVLQKESEPRQKLLTAISTNRSVQEAIEDLISSIKNVSMGDLELFEGEWLMIWSSQMETDSWIENAGNGLMGKQIVRPNGRMKFLVDILLGLKFSMDGTFAKSGSNKYNVTMNDAAILAGQFGLPVEMQTKFSLELLYADEKIRISRGYNKITFVHVRMDGSKRN